MKLKTRLKVSFCVMVIIPIVVTGMLITVMFHLQATNIQEEYDVDSTMEVEDVYTSVNMIYQISKNVYDRVKADIRDNADAYNDIAYVENIAARISKKLVEVALIKDGELVYSNSMIDTSMLMEIISQESDIYDDGERGIYYGGEVQSVVKQIDFTDSDGHAFSLYLITSLKQVVPQVRGLIAESIIIIIVVLTIMGSTLTVWIYRAMVRPLSRLTLATNNIKEGNLDFEMQVEGNDEIAEVCRNFEEMRLILKETAEQKLADEQEEKELIRNISHDLKTPLTAIKGYIEGLIDGVANTPAKQEKYLMTIANKVNDMDRLINELTVYSRIDSNREPYVFKKINVKDYWGDCYEEISTELEAKGIKLCYCNYLQQDVYIMADAEQLKRVINNIISNSVKYIHHDKGVIVIEIHLDGEEVVTAITDNGKGIAQEDLKHIFERFYRTDSSRNSSEGGSGIGLAIVKKIIEDHKGSIEAASVEGEGTKLTFRLPVYKAEEGAQDEFI